MRKLLVLVMLALLVVVFPVAAQDEPTQSIAEIVVASTEAETPEFTTLLAAVSAADPAFLEALSDPDANLTVFAPTDAAFLTLIEALETTPEDLLANTDLLNVVLAYHVVPGMFNAEAVVALDGAYLGTLVPGYALRISVEEGAVLVNESTVVTADVMATNGIVHVIDAVLVPEATEATEEEMMEMEEPTQSIAEIVVASTEAETPEFTTLLAAVSAADPSILELLSSDGAYTVFAPTDAAFAALLDALGVTAEDLLADTELLNTVLAYHVLPGIFTAADLGRYVTATTEMDPEAQTAFATLLPGFSVVIGEGSINDSGIVATDIMATNGIVHVIDAVLLPPTE